MAFNQNLTNAERRKVWRELMKDEGIGDISVSKEDLRLFVDTADQWITDNVQGIYSSMPNPPRGDLTGAQRAYIFLAVARAKIKG